MSILSIYNSGADAGKQRKDIKTVEGEVVQENHSIKGDVEDVAIGTAGGSTVGLLFSHVLRGTVFGLAGSGAYIAAKKARTLSCRRRRACSCGWIRLWRFPHRCCTTRRTRPAETKHRIGRTSSARTAHRYSER